MQTSQTTSILATQTSQYHIVEQLYTELYKAKLNKDKAKLDKDIAKLAFGQEEPPKATLIKTSNGSTGFTFFGTLLKDKVLDQVVLKWTSQKGAVNEKIGNEFFKAFGFNTPNISFCERNLATNLTPFATALSHAVCYENIHEIMVMPKLPGMPFEDFFNQGFPQLLEDPDLEKIGLEIGRTAIYDIALGNPDRFVRFEAEYPYLGIPGPNLGNILIELGMTRPNKGLMNIFHIDTSSNQALKFLKEESPYTDDDVFIDLYNDTPDEETSNTEAISNSLSKDSEVADAPLSELQMLQKRSQELNWAFASLIQSQDNLKTHIKEGLDKVIKPLNCNPGEDPVAHKETARQSLEKIMAFVKTGFEKALTEMAERDTSTFDQILVENGVDGDPYYQTLLEMIKRNFEEAKKYKSAEHQKTE